jgi:hypothetical protein
LQFILGWRPEPPRKDWGQIYGEEPLRYETEAPQQEQQA